MDDRREYFRIEQYLGACLTPLSDSSITDPYDATLDLPPTLTLVNQIRELEQDAALTLKKIQAKQGDTARYLKNLNQRLGILERAVLTLDKSYPDLTWQTANYSEAGICLKSPNAFQPKDNFHLIIALPDPSQRNSNVCHWLSIIATLVGCDQAPESEEDTSQPSFRLGMNFKYVNDIDKQYLARHILSVQSVRRRQALDDAADIDGSEPAD